MTSQDKRPEDDALSSSSGQALRQRAETIFLKKAAQLPQQLEALSPEATQQMLHELKVHQIDLEMQNEELRRAQVELDTSRARYFDLYDLAPIGYCTVSESGLILQANLTAATLLGVVRGALVKQRISRLILKADQDIYYLQRKQIIETDEPQSYELRMVKNDGTQFWAHLATTAAQDADGSPELRIVLSDITERKRVEAERVLFDQVLQDKNTELESAKIVAEKANLAKSEFLSSMSHELRTPLGSILGFAQLIESGSPQLTPTQKQSIDQILKAGWYLLELINEILDLALIESGKLSLWLESISLAEVMRECEAMVEPQAKKNGISVTFSPFEISYFVKVDRTRLKQVLINLLSNAIKYNKMGGTVVVDCIVSTTGCLRICVKDTGAGLAPDKLTQLFQPFNRLGQEENTEKGTGIGLVVCKRLVELMGGVIGVESTVGKGSVFWVELNLTTEPQATAHAAELTAVGLAQAQAEAKLHTLLYVEDNLANLMLVESLIERWPNTRFLSARDAIRGIEIARASGPDIILMDISLPGITGIEALRILAEDPATAHIPVIALSANAMSRDIEKGLEAGFFRYLTKPIKVNELMDTLNVALEFVKMEAALAAKKE